MKKVLLLFVMVGASDFLGADTIEVHNKSSFDLYGAVYYFKKVLNRVGQVKLIKSRQKEKFERPPFQLLPHRRLVLSLNQGDLKPVLTTSEYHILPHVPIGVGSTFYIALDKGKFKGYNTIEWKAIEPIKRKFAPLSQKIDELTLGQVRRLYTKGDLSKVPVTVRRSTDLPREELAYQQERKKKVKRALEQLLQTQLTDNEVPRISFCGSGGGYRAMIGLLGSMQAAQYTGLLDTATYISGVSGSTWMIGPWLQSGWSLDELQRRLQQKITKDFYLIVPSIPSIINNLIMRLAFKQPITPVNIYGRMLAHNLLSDLPGGPLNAFMSQQAERVKTGDWIFPIYTAVTTKLPYQWIEFTPFEAGGDYFGGYIPISAFGAPFLNGKMRFYTPPYHLSYILGISGSAFAARLSHIVNEFQEKIPFAPLKKALIFGAEKIEVGELAPFRFRPAAAHVYNWTYGMLGLPRSQQEFLRIIDAGISYNLGLEALMRRKSDIIIIFDFSASSFVGKELQKAEKDLRARGFVLPPIDYTGLENKTYAIFKDPNNVQAPIIIYLSLIKNPAFPRLNPRDCFANWCGTFTFDYTVARSTELIDLARKNMEDAAPAIIDEIKQWVEAKKKR